MSASAVWPSVISAVTALGVLLGVILSRRGKREDNSQQAISDQFNRMLSENTYLTTQLTAARAETNSAHAETSAVRREWEDRWTRQASRCRSITDKLAQTVVRLLGELRTPQPEAEKVLRHLDAHNEADHTPEERTG